MSLLNLKLVQENFTVLKNTKDNSLSFLIIGDWGREGSLEQHTTAAEMARQANRRKADFIISTGDNFYENGVDSTHDPLWQTCFEKVYHQSSLQIPWYSILGNHDYRSNTSAQILYTQQSSRWRMPARYYSQTFEISSSCKALIIFTDTTPFIGEYWETENHPDVLMQKPEEQLIWFEQTLANSNAHWKIVVGHHPLYSSSPMHGDSEELIAQFQPLFETYGVDAYLCGHEHDLQLQKPEGDTIYLVSGAGSEVRETASKAMTLFSSSDPGFAHIQLDEQWMNISFVNNLGQQIFKTQQKVKDYTSTQGFE